MTFCNISLHDLGDNNLIWADRPLSELVAELIVLFLICIFGVFGNTLVIAALATEKNIFKSGNVFIINLAVADLLVSVFLCS